jgi:hypothetical protein
VRNKVDREKETNKERERERERGRERGMKDESDINKEILIFKDKLEELVW